MGLLNRSTNINNAWCLPKECFQQFMLSKNCLAVFPEQYLLYLANGISSLQVPFQYISVVMMVILKDSYY